MPCNSKRKYGNGGQVTTHVDSYADGGLVKKNKMRKPKKGAKPKKIETDNPPGGPKTPGAKAKKMADGGPVYGAPLSTPKPGTTTRKRPKVGDKSSDKRLLNPKKRKSSKPPAKKKPKGSTYRDYRGVDGAVEDAVKGKRKKK